MRKMIKELGEWIPNPAYLTALTQKNGKNVVAVLYQGRRLLRYIFGDNIVTTKGEIHYAQRCANEAPTDAFTTMWLCTGRQGNVNGAPTKTDNRGDYNDISGSSKANSSGYPKSNDNDTDNTGASNNAVTWLFSYAAGDGNFSAITHCYVTKSGNTANDVLLCGVKFGANNTSWSKDSNTSAKVFVNHAQNGV